MYVLASSPPSLAEELRLLDVVVVVEAHEDIRISPCRLSLRKRELGAAACSAG
jgi:hypothetical protein